MSSSSSMTRIGPSGPSFAIAMTSAGKRGSMRPGDLEIAGEPPWDHEGTAISGVTERGIENLRPRNTHDLPGDSTTQSVAFLPDHRDVLYEKAVGAPGRLVLTHWRVHGLLTQFLTSPP